MFTDILSLFVGFSAIIGNALVCRIILHSKFVKKTAFNYVLLNLAILDVITSILAVYKALIHGPLYNEDKGDGIMRVYNQSYVGAEVMCKIKQSFWIGTRMTPAFLLVIAYERYKAIVKPLSRRSAEISNAKLKLVILLSWIWGSIPLVVYMISRSIGEKGCNSVISQWFNPTMYTILSSAICFLVPTAVISVLYYKVIKAISRNEQLGVQAAAQRAREASRRNVIAIIITVTVLFYVFCGFPYLAYITSVVFNFELWSDSVQTLLYSINSVTNPFIYFVFMKSFRMGLTSIFKCNNQNNTIPQSQHSLAVSQNSSFKNVTTQQQNNIELLKITDQSSLENNKNQ